MTHTVVPSANLVVVCVVKGGRGRGVLFTVPTFYIAAIHLVCSRFHFDYCILLVTPVPIVSIGDIYIHGKRFPSNDSTSINISLFVYCSKVQLYLLRVYPLI